MSYDGSWVKQSVSYDGGWVELGLRNSTGGAGHKTEVGLDCTGKVVHGIEMGPNSTAHRVS